MSNKDLADMMTSVDMEEWLGYEGIDYRLTSGTRGQQLNVKTCPSCGKDSWKVYLNAETGLGNCFSGSCPKGTFNKFSFIKEHLLNFDDRPNVIQHIREFLREMGWRPKRDFTTAVEMESEDLELPDHQLLPINGKNLKYLSHRRVDLEMCKYFNLGYVTSGYFKERVLIPIHDLDGGLVSFQARDITNKAERKYLFPRGFASTGRVLYNGHNAWRKKHLLMVEGAFDVIGAKIAMSEDPNLRRVGIVGSFGISLSGDSKYSGDDQLSRFIQLKESGLETVTIMWDSEKQALKKAVSAGLTLKSIGIEVRIAVLPSGRDPSDVAPAILRECFIKATSLNQRSALKLALLPIV